MSYILSLLTLVAQLVAAVSAHAQTPAVLRGEALMRALQSGGYTVLVRHARTDRSIPNKETPGTVPALRADQRNLTAAGEQDVRVMSAVVQKYAWPIGEVISSPSYRCRETADAFGPASVTMALRVFPTTAETAALVTAVPKPGTNRVLVTHHFVIENHVPGITPGDINESEAAVVRPSGDGKVTLVGKILLADWEALAGGRVASGTPATPPAPVQSVTHKPVSPVAHGTAPQGAVVIPATRAGKLAAGYLGAFNSGDPARMKAFMEASLVAVPDRPTEARVETYVRFFEDHGPLAVTGIQSSTADQVALQARSKRGDLIVTVTASPDHADRAQSVTFTLLQGGGGH